MAYPHISIVLVNPSHPGNIGAVARAMHTSALTSLHMVHPTAIDDVAYARASGAQHVLDNAICHSHLSDAIKSADLVIGTTMRTRRLQRKVLSPNTLHDVIVSGAKHVALLFGNERTGLSNEALSYCHYYLSIPTASDRHSLNLAAAVQVVVSTMYEARLASAIPDKQQKPDNKGQILACAGQINQFIDHLHHVNCQTGFYKDKNPSHALGRFRAMLLRSHPRTDEIALCHGILSAMDRYINLQLSKHQTHSPTEKT